VSTIADPRDIIVAPVVSEKSYGELNRNWYTFQVHPDANKTEIKIAIQQIFNVRVLTVNTLNRNGKRKRTKTGYSTDAATLLKLRETSSISANSWQMSKILRDRHFQCTEGALACRSARERYCSRWPVPTTRRRPI